MVESRIIPSLLLKEDSLVKTIRFKSPNYIGDAINTVRIFNELEVDELLLLDIEATKKKRSINFELLEQIANECFMPLAYGGGIRSVDEAKKIISIGFEKIVVNSIAFEHPEVVIQIAKEIGSQSIVGAIDITKNIFGKKIISSYSNTKFHSFSFNEWALKLQEYGVGELLINCVYREGTWLGLDLQLIDQLSPKITIPIILLGGANELENIKKAFEKEVSAVGVGNMVVYQKKGMGVLINTKKITG